MLVDGFKLHQELVTRFERLDLVTPAFSHAHHITVALAMLNVYDYVGACSRYIEGGGDDVLIGGLSKSGLGGYIADLYRFGSGSGNDVIIGFTPSQQYADAGNYGDQYDTIDRLEIAK